MKNYEQKIKNNHKKDGFIINESLKKDLELKLQSLVVQKKA